MNRLFRVLASLAALATLLLVLVGIPVALVVLVGWPVPSPLPTTDTLGDIVAGRAPLPSEYVISALAVVLWLVWLQVVWVAAVELAAALRGRLARRVRTLPGLQLGVAKLVAAATFLATSFSLRPATAAPLAPVAAVHATVDGHVAAVATAEVSSAASADPKPYLTKPGDTWWGIAEQSLGSGTRWKEVRSLNLGRTMADGSTISAATDLLRPDWRLLLPATAVTDDEGGRQVMVERGDTLWGLAEEDLGDEPSMPAVADRVEQIIDLNADRLDDPDLIYPGQELALPPMPESAAVASADGSGSGGAEAAVGEAVVAPLSGSPPMPPPETALPSDPTSRTSISPRVSSPGAETSPTTAGPQATSAPPTTSSPTTAAPPTTSSPATPAPATSAPPTTSSPTTAAPPTTSSPATAAPPTSSPTTAAPPTTSLPATTASPPSSAEAPAAAERTAAGDPVPGDGSSAADPAGDDAAAGTARAASEAAGGPEDVARSSGSATETPTTALPSTGPSEPAAPALPSDRPADVSSLAGARAVAPGLTPPTTASALTPIGQSDAGPATSEEAAPTPTAEYRQGTVDPDIETARIGADGLPIDPRSSAALDLATTGDLSDAEVISAQGAAEPDAELDTTTDRAPVFVGLAALTLVGGYLYRARGRRRDTTLQHRHPGKRPMPAKHRTRSVARRLAAAAEPDHAEFVNTGLRALGRLLQTTRADRLPEISGVWVSHNRLVIALSGNSPRVAPPEPFTQFADGSGWCLRRSDFGRAREIAKGANGPLPLLVTVGTTTALDLALTTSSRAPADAYGLSSSLLFAVDLEPARVVSVQAADDVSTIEVLTMMALELATSETADQVEIVCVGFGHRLATFERVMVVDDLAEIVDDLENITSRAVYASAAATPFATRVGNGAADTWNPVIVFHPHATDPDATTLIELADQTEGGVTAVCGYPTDRGWTFRVDGERVSSPNLPGDLARHEFRRPVLEGMELIPQLFDEAAEQEPLDEGFWQPLQPADTDHSWEVFEPENESWRPMRRVSPVGGQAAPGVSAGDEDGPRSSLATVVRPTDGAPARQSSDLDLPTLDRLKHSVEQPPPAPPPGAESPDGPVGPSGEPPAQPPPFDWPMGPPDPNDRAPAPDGPDRESDDHADAEATEEAPATDPDREPEREPTDDRPSGRHLRIVAPPADERPDDDPDSTTARHEPVDRDPADGPLDPTSSSAPVGDERQCDIVVSVLGNFTIDGHHVGDRAKPWKYSKTPELILYLLLHPSGASQDLLMEQLFPEQPPNRPRLNQLVSDARTKALGKNPDGDYHLPHAAPTEPFYKLLPTVGFDLRDFARHCAKAKSAESPQVQMRAWEAALKLVNGRPFTVPHGGYEWALPEIEATIVKVEEAALALAELALEFGEHELAVWATKKGLLTGTGYYELLVTRGRAALLLEDPEEIVRAFADLQVSLEYGGAPEEGMPDLSDHPDLEEVYSQLSSGGRSKDRNP